MNNMNGMNMNAMNNPANGNGNFFPDGIVDMGMNSMSNMSSTGTGNTGVIVTPPEESFNSEAMRGSMQQILSDNLGQFVVCEFLIGTAAPLVRKEGILYSVGRSYVALYEETNRNFIVCDIFSIKFVTFYLPNMRPQRSAAPPPVSRGNAGNLPR